MSKLLHDSSNNSCSVLVLDDPGYIKALLPMDIVPSTSADYLALILETLYSIFKISVLSGKSPQC